MGKFITLNRRKNMLLPVGSIVYLVDGNQKLVILNRASIVDQSGKKFILIIWAGYSQKA